MASISKTFAAVSKRVGLTAAVRITPTQQCTCTAQKRSFKTTAATHFSGDAATLQSDAERAVNNLLYNVPAPSQQASRRVLSLLVANETGVLSRVSGILAGRGFNIESLVVSSTEVPILSRMTVVLEASSSQVEQARR